MRVGGEVAVARPAPFQAETVRRMRWPTSCFVSLYCVPHGFSTSKQSPSEQSCILPSLIRTHTLPLAEQRSHLSVNMYGERVQLVSASETVYPTFFVPMIHGLCLIPGGLAATGPLPLERADAEPAALVAVT